MSDLGPHPHDDELRRLLRDAREREPMPPEVVARLDDVLAGLREEDRPATPPADLAAARRRRTRLRTALVAAAAVVVVGYGISQVDLGSTGSDDSMSSDAGGSSADDAPPAAPSRAGSPPAASLPTPRELRLDSRHFQSQVQAEGADVNDLLEGLDTSGRAAQDCDDPAWGAGERVPVTYDGRPGVLVYRPAGRRSQRVDLFLCGATDPTRSTTVPSR